MESICCLPDKSVLAYAQAELGRSDLMSPQHSLLCFVRTGSCYIELEVEIVGPGDVASESISSHGEI